MSKRVAHSTYGARPPRVERRRGLRGIRDAHEDSGRAKTFAIRSEDIAIGEAFLLLDTTDTSRKYRIRRSGAGALRFGGGLGAAAVKLSRRRRCPSAELDLARASLLGPFLKGIRPSFYLLLRVLPTGMRDPVGLAYLLARAAKVIAGASPISPGDRLDLLLALRAQVNRGADDPAFGRGVSEVAGLLTPPDEKRLLESLKLALAVLARLDAPDREAVSACVTTLFEGMGLDLRTFPDEHAGRMVALSDFAELDRYAYLVAGCVGEFWTTLAYAHVPDAFANARDTLLRQGVRFGKALRLTKMLSDGAKDLRIGRCYFPQALLERAGLGPEDLLLPDASSRARPVLEDVARIALGHYRSGLDYTLAIHRTSMWLRLACVWPMMIGLKTLSLVAENEAWLAPGHALTPRRRDVAQIIAVSLVAAMSNVLLRHWVQRIIARIEARLARG